MPFGEGRHLIVSTLLLLSAAALTPLAYISPTDPSWIPGIYDYADFDEAVDMITSSTAVTTAVPVADFRTILPISGFATYVIENDLPALLCSLGRSRAPPASET